MVAPESPDLLSQSRKQIHIYNNGIIRKKLMAELHPAPKEINNIQNNINKITFNRVCVFSLPITTGMVSRPRSLSLCISIISDMDDRMKTRTNVKIKATAILTLKFRGLFRAGRTAVTIPHASAVEKFFDPGMSFNL